MSNTPLRDADALAADFIKKRTPPREQWSEYRETAGFYAEAHEGDHPGFQRRGMRVAARGFSFRKSVIFRREYLIAWVDGAAFRAAAPHMDALMTPVSLPQGLSALSALPVILASEEHQRTRSRLFVSVLEHEIVHVNQALIGFTIPSFAARSASQAIDDYFGYLMLEFEAHFIQLARWPSKEMIRSGLPFEQWVLLRAHTASLERTLYGAAAGDIARRTLPAFLDSVPKLAPGRLEPLGARPDLVAWFQHRWAHDVAIALRVIEAEGTDTTTPAMSGVRGWLAAADPGASSAGGDASRPSRARRGPISPGSR